MKKEPTFYAFGVHFFFFVDHSVESRLNLDSRQKSNNRDKAFPNKVYSVARTLEPELWLRMKENLALHYNPCWSWWSIYVVR